ncbi:PAS domain S-box protein [Aerosakkonema funiforme]|uniref:PAS domain S-box protein n=1 Tax=Aerosakkonema funiforme TaxID=1246630 RepID=UPI0035BAE0B9
MRSNRQFLAYGVAIGSTAIALLVSMWLELLLAPIISPLFYIAIIVTAWYGGFRSGSVAVVLSMLAIDYFFVPVDQLWPAQPGDILRLGIFLLVGTVINLLTSHLQESKKKIERLNQQLIQQNAEILEDSATQLGLALSAARMGMWDWNLVTGEIKWSPEHALLLGLEPGTFDGKYETFDARVHPEDRQDLNKAIEQVLQTKSIYQHEFRVIWPDGSLHWVEGRGQRFDDEAGQAVRMIGTVANVDDRKRTETLLHQQVEQQRLLMEMTQRIRQSLNLQAILQTTVEQMREFLQCDRTIVFQFAPGWSGQIVVESVKAGCMALLPLQIHDPCIGEQYVEPFKKGLITVKSDIYNSGLNPCHIEFLANLQVKANLVAPILVGDELWGLLAAHHCTAPHQWQDYEIESIRQIAIQAGIAIQQADLFEQLQTELRERKQVEISLQETQIQLQRQLAEIEAIYQSAPIGLSVLDTDLRFVRINQRLAEMNGFSVEAHIGRTVAELLPNLADTAEQLLRSIFATGQPILNVEICGETPSQPGVQRVWLENFFPLKDGDRIIGISTVCEEITERKQAEIALKEREKTLNLFFKYVPAGVAIFDRNLHYLIASQRWVDDYKVESVESIIGRSHYEVFPEIPDRWRQIHQRCLAGASEQCEEDFLERQDGQKLWVRWEIIPWYKGNEEIGGIIIFSEEITKRKQAQIALQKLNAELEQRVIERTKELTDVNARLLVTLLEKEQAYQLLKEQAQLLDLAHDSIITWDLNSVITFWNQGAESMYGWTKAEAFGQEMHSLLKTQFLQPLTEIEAELLAKGYWEGELIHLTKDDRPITVSSRWVVQKDDAFKVIKILEINNDISDRKQAEKALLQKSRKEQLLWCVTQAIRQSLELNIILNTAVTEVREILQTDRAVVYRFNLDWSGDFVIESVGENWLKLVGSEVQKVWTDTYLQATQGGRFRYNENFIVNDIYRAGLQPCHIQLLEQFQAKSYAIFPIFAEKTLWGLLAVYQNATSREWQSWEVELLQQIASQLSIAIQQSQLYGQLQTELQERQQAEATIREAERRWRSLLDNVQSIVVGFDRAGNVNYANPFFFSLTRYTSQEVLGKNWFENFLPSSIKLSIQSVFSELLNGYSHLYYRNAILTKSGEEKLIAWHNTVLQDSEGNIIGTISIGEDITERQRLEKIKDEFIGIVSHELRTPLTAIQMSLGLLESGIYDKKPEKFRRLIEIALLDTNRLVNLVNDILDLERLESGSAVLEKTVCQATDLIQQAVNGIQQIADRQQISLSFTPTDAEVWAAADAIVQTLTNLLTNAIKFSPAHSTVRISIEHQTEFVLFQVSDRGRGIPADKLELIFGRFQQVDASDSREKGGTGLGLAICRSIIERHGGKIWAESILGEGSTFFFTLPLPSIQL